MRFCRLKKEENNFRKVRGINGTEGVGKIIEGV